MAFPPHHFTYSNQGYGDLYAWSEGTGLSQMGQPELLDSQALWQTAHQNLLGLSFGPNETLAFYKAFTEDDCAGIYEILLGDPSHSNHLGSTISSIRYSPDRILDMVIFPPLPVIPQTLFVPSHDRHLNDIQDTLFFFLPGANIPGVPVERALQGRGGHVDGMIEDWSEDMHFATHIKVHIHLVNGPSYDSSFNGRRTGGRSLNRGNFLSHIASRVENYYRDELRVTDVSFHDVFILGAIHCSQGRWQPILAEVY